MQHVSPDSMLVRLGDDGRGGGSLGDVLELFRAVAEREIRLIGARTASGTPEEATVVSVEADQLHLSGKNLNAYPGRVLRFNLRWEGAAYVFSVRVVSCSGGIVVTELPPAVFEAERRDHVRRQIRQGEDAVARLWGNASSPQDTRILDYSPAGLQVESPTAEIEPSGWVLLKTPGGTPQRLHYQTRHIEALSGKEAGSCRIGLRVSSVPFADLAPVAVEDAIVRRTPGMRYRARMRLVRESARLAAARIVPGIGSRRVIPARRVAFLNEQDEEIIGYLDQLNSMPNVGIVIPPAFGRTKETLLPLAQVVLENLMAHGLAPAILRFDGTRRRGESFVPVECRTAGREHEQFSVSAAVRDLEAAIKFLGTQIGVSRIYVVTFSAASIEGRRAMVRDATELLAGWVSVVGASDLQSGLRSVSGGADFIGAKERGEALGKQELMGVRVDMDLIAEDAIRENLAFLEDARREMADIASPITWIHGQHDAWLDLARVREIMGCGPQSDRRLLSVPTGHQLRSSREALDVFQLVATELARMETGRAISTRAPDLVALERKRRLERRHRKTAETNTRDLWARYLQGENGGLRIDLMNSTAAYRQLMQEHISGLQLADSEVVADLGSGTGSFSRFLASQQMGVRTLTIHEFDFVASVLRRTRSASEMPGLVRRQIVVDFDRGGIPAKTRSYDAVLACLVANYLRDPSHFFSEVARILKPGGRLSVSGMRPDADVSRLFVEGIAELRGGALREAFGLDAERTLVADSRAFLNQAAKVIDLEEQGVFSFWDAVTLTQMVEEAGLAVVGQAEAFGRPPQAVVLHAIRP